MAHRVRSRTAESADGKRAKGTPRRLTEKIAIMKRREHEQSEAFEQAMRSIFEMQRARVGGGGSMPSLQAIDDVPQQCGADMQVAYNDLSHMNQLGMGSVAMAKERPHSGGPQGRRLPLARRTASCDAEPFPAPAGLNLPEHWSMGSSEWVDGDLARHKSDSDLQQSLLQQQMAQAQPLAHTSLHQHQQQNHRMTAMAANHTPLSLWGNKRPGPMSAALLSPEQYPSQDNTLSVATPSLGSVGGASSLPDLTSIEFSSGLDVPLDGEEPMNEQPSLQRLSPYDSPPMLSGPGLSNLLYATHPFSSSPSPSSSPSSQWRGPPPLYSNSASASFNASITTNGAVFSGQRAPTAQSFANHRPPLHPPAPAVGVRKSPTMPDFRSLSSSGPAAGSFSRPPSQFSNPTPGYKHILPASSPGTPNHSLPYRPFSTGTSASFPHQLSSLGQPPSPLRAPPPMTIIIQPPTVSASLPVSPTTLAQTPLTAQTPPHRANGFDLSGQLPLLAPVPSRPTFSVGGGGGAMASIPPTPVMSLGSALPSYIEAKQQQALQQKFASFNVKNELIVRSHSEENLQKAQKEKGDLTHNPFMGNLANANSVPCVYVESSGLDLPPDRTESPPPGDSPSTTASYASSPPSLRPYWIDHPNELAYNEWPLQEKVRQGSPPNHHRSLTDLSTIPEVSELSPSNRSRSLLHQFSLPPIVMGDYDDQLERQHYPVFGHDFSMEEDSMMDTLLKDDSMVGMGFGGDITRLLGSDSFIPGGGTDPLTANHRLHY